MKEDCGSGAWQALLPTRHTSLFLQVNEIYHDESLGVHINIALVRLIMVGYRQVNPLVSRQSLGREGVWGQHLRPVRVLGRGQRLGNILSPEPESGDH